MMTTQEWQNQKLGYSPKRNAKWVLVDFRIATAAFNDFGKTMKTVVEEITRSFFEAFNAVKPAINAIAQQFKLMMYDTFIFQPKNEKKIVSLKDLMV